MLAVMEVTRSELNAGILKVCKYVFAGALVIALIVCILLSINNSSGMKYIEATSAHDAYFIYNNVDCLITGEGQELSHFLPQEATDIWISHESGFGYEDWQVSCIVSETDFRRFVNEWPDMRMSVIDVFGFDFFSYKMCNLFYQKRLGISLEAIRRIRTRDRFLECYVYDKNRHWHLTYCYDRVSNYLFCDFGR